MNLLAKIRWEDYQWISAQVRSLSDWPHVSATSRLRLSCFSSTDGRQVNVSSPYLGHYYFLLAGEAGIRPRVAGDERLSWKSALQGARRPLAARGALPSRFCPDAPGGRAALYSLCSLPNGTTTLAGGLLPVLQGGDLADTGQVIRKLEASAVHLFSQIADPEKEIHRLPGRPEKDISYTCLLSRSTCQVRNLHQ